MELVPRTRLQIACQSCANCNQTSPNDYICSRCHRAQYCDSTCQRSHFKKHKLFCKAIAEVNEMYYDDFLDGDIQKWNELVVKKLGALELYFSRDLTPFEKNIFLFEPKCQKCFITGEGLRKKNGARLKPCQECRIVFYCSDECWSSIREQHQLCCVTYKSVVECDETMYEAQMMDKHGTMWTPENWVDEKYFGLSEGWNEYFMWRKAPPFPDTYRMCVTDKLSQPLTILSALETFYGREIITQWDELTIHVCGGTTYEVLGLMAMEELQHILTCIKVLHIVLIDPTMEEDIDCHLLQMCPRCAEAGRQRFVSTYGKTYHRYVASQGYKKPKLVVAFNSGLCEGDVLWQPTIKILIDMEIPSIFTSHSSKMAELDAKMFRALGAQIVSEPEENIFKSQVPLPAPTELDKFYYNNCWKVGFCGMNRSYI